ncbi:hypothetical protein Cgig2_017729 [Carnegiea gigantea]|uniref:Uncharacterized protein n=1 Tax=Carnegiea gigantea TaxID=171969 RepID=A0A9Q1GZA7_9CARY|nr:hypothetical protein Cgig2_017729 [Carnegiea gigantea]
MRFQELGLSKLANQLITKAKGHRGKDRGNHVHDEEDQEYIPEENGDEDLLNMGEEHAIEDVTLTSTANCISNKHKYILPQIECVKKWVLESIAYAWRLFKYRLKANHCYKYDNDGERWKHRPKIVLNLLWVLEEANRDGQPPSKRMMFEETQKRKDGRSYKKSFDDMLGKIVSV